MIKVNGIEVKDNRFPDGTQLIKLEEKIIREVDLSPCPIVTIEVLGVNEDMNLWFITKHLKGIAPDKRFVLKIPYAPHARMDRVKSNDEVFTLKHWADFINSLDFDEVLFRDGHSSVLFALVNNSRETFNKQTIFDVINHTKITENDLLFYPNEGAVKRYSEMANHPYAFGIKKRDWKTGNILGLEIHGEDVKDKNILIIDDISSYGGTFLYSAKTLKDKGANKIYLYVTHLEETVLYGDIIDSGLIEEIITTESIFPDISKRLKASPLDENFANQLEEALSQCDNPEKLKKAFKEVEPLKLKTPITVMGRNGFKTYK